MKTLLFSLALLLTACGSADTTTTEAPAAPEVKPEPPKPPEPPPVAPVADPAAPADPAAAPVDGAAAPATGPAGAPAPTSTGAKTESKEEIHTSGPGAGVGKAPPTMPAGGATDGAKKTDAPAAGTGGAAKGGARK